METGVTMDLPISKAAFITVYMTKDTDNEITD
jgi:hypothetical protein